MAYRDEVSRRVRGGVIPPYGEILVSMGERLKTPPAIVASSINREGFETYAKDISERGRSDFHKEVAFGLWLEGKHDQSFAVFASFVEALRQTENINRTIQAHIERLIAFDPDAARNALKKFDDEKGNVCAPIRRAIFLEIYLAKEEVDLVFDDKLGIDRLSVDHTAKLASVMDSKPIEHAGELKMVLAIVESGASLKDLLKSTGRQSSPSIP